MWVGLYMLTVRSAGEGFLERRRGSEPPPHQQVVCMWESAVNSHTGAPKILNLVCIFGLEIRIKTV